MKARYVLISAILAIFSSIAVAGYVQPVPVSVDFDRNTAQGDMFTARTAANDVEFIGCGIRHTDDGVNEHLFGFCQASDADANRILCTTQTESLLETIRSSAAYSFITFSWVEDDTEYGGFDCTRVGFSNQSFYLPKK